MTELSEKTRQQLRQKVAQMASQYAEVGRLLSEPDVASDSSRLAELAREYGRLGRFSEADAELRRLDEVRREADESIAQTPDDEELRQLATDEFQEADRAEESLMQDLIELFVSEDREADRNVIMEIRAGTGGEEAALFAGNLYRMYCRHAERQGWKVEMMDSSATDMGGLREVIFSVSGRGAWKKLRYESGGHRVQRVPETESQGRIHTSLATVAVLPEAEEFDIKIDLTDVEMSFMRSSGPGGQKVNKTSSCVRLVHKPTGITVRCQDEKSQGANRKKAMKILRAKLYEKHQSEIHQERDSLRRSLVGSGDRGERIRTYNFPQDRITDHRIGVDAFGIDNFLMGDCDRLFDALAAFDRQERITAFVESQGETSPSEP